MAVAQVLEYGIAAHSVIIGIALGVSSSPCTIRPLAAALVFHQMFEGIALGATLISAGYHGCVFWLIVKYICKWPSLHLHRRSADLCMQAACLLELCVHTAVSLKDDPYTPIALSQLFTLPRRLTYVLMAMLFAVTTPLGVGIGLGIRTTYNENSATALGVQGTFESVSNIELCSDWENCKPSLHACYSHLASCAALLYPVNRVDTQCLDQYGHFG